VVGLTFALSQDSAASNFVIAVAAVAMGIQNATGRNVAVADITSQLRI
jgi:hypothetical protein